ncbi:MULTISPECIES: phage neck terminator protein [unclassified Archaeoglobus]|jgi:hypothetical protein|uniref:phage neck terminator protein n=1 Tax=unclassified Archaeoglobus TaxID=2643606 RepID=UPI0025BC54C1|nr:MULTISPECIES: hypothetical protein [unclassified Archaeoglobus]
MLETKIWQELYNSIPKQVEIDGNIVDVKIYRAKQKIKPSYPMVLVNFLDPVVDLNTPLNHVFKVELSNESVKYTKGVVLRQSIDLSIYDRSVKRIAKLQEIYYLWALKLKLTDVTISRVLPPRNLDFVESGYIYRRAIEIVCKYSVTWEELVGMIKEVEFSIDTQ